MFKRKAKKEDEWFSASFLFKSDKADNLTPEGYCEIINKIAQSLEIPIIISSLQVRKVPKWKPVGRILDPFPIDYV